MTLTRCALGAHTAKCTPVTPPIVMTMRAELLPRAQVRALAEQVQVEVRQDLAELIGIGDLARASVFMRAESIREIRRASLERQPRLEQAVGMPAWHRRDLPVGDRTPLPTPPAASSARSLLDVDQS